MLDLRAINSMFDDTHSFACVSSLRLRPYARTVVWLPDVGIEGSAGGVKKIVVDEEIN